MEERASHFNQAEFNPGGGSVHQSEGSLWQYLPFSNVYFLLWLWVQFWYSFEKELTLNIQSIMRCQAPVLLILECIYTPNVSMNLCYAQRDMYMRASYVHIWLYQKK